MKRRLVGIDATAGDRLGRFELRRTDGTVLYVGKVAPVLHRDDGYWPPLPAPDDRWNVRFTPPLVVAADGIELVTRDCEASLVWAEV